MNESDDQILKSILEKPSVAELNDAHDFAAYSADQRKFIADMKVCVAQRIKSMAENGTFINISKSELRKIHAINQLLDEIAKEDGGFYDFHLNISLEVVAGIPEKKVFKPVDEVH